MRDFALNQAQSTGAIGVSLAALFANWLARREIVKLKNLDDKELSQIGVTREDVCYAICLPLAENAKLALEQRAFLRSRAWLPASGTCHHRTPASTRRTTKHAIVSHSSWYKISVRPPQHHIAGTAADVEHPEECRRKILQQLVDKPLVGAGEVGPGIGLGLFAIFHQLGFQHAQHGVLPGTMVTSNVELAVHQIQAGLARQESVRTTRAAPVSVHENNRLARPERASRRGKSPGGRHSGSGTP
jgi:uncharacterized protein YjiS (DUF1127 family)